jgi:hypothetical protein
MSMQLVCGPVPNLPAGAQVLEGGVDVAGE